WKGLFGGSSAAKKRAQANDPQQRLARFKQRYNQVLQTWQKSESLASDRDALVNIRRGFQGLTKMLEDESRLPAPHLCLSFAAGQQIYTAVSKIAATSHDEGMVRDSVQLYNALIDSEEEDFLENDVFAVSLMNFIGRSIGSITLGEDIEADIVELLFGIAAKIRLQPEILPVWFTTASADSIARPANQKKVDFAGVTQKEDFPLCYQLIDKVHHEGRIGEFARMGLLYIFESASKSLPLEQWIVNSDLPTLMATGLGALYSQLSRLLSILHPSEDMPLVLQLSDYSEMHANPDATSLFSDDFQSHLLTFLSYLTFWQDVLEHCRSTDVRHTLIDHFQVLFLQQLLYPYIVQSSDADGGSSVAVLTYLRRVLDALDHPELVHMILQYLLALPDYSAATSLDPRSPAALKRRQSLMLINGPKQEEDSMSPSLFNLVDLILQSADSRNPQTVIAALKLTTVLVSKNHGYALGSLVKVTNIHHSEPHRTVGALNIELETYLNIAINIAGENGVDDAYESHLKDKLSILESHPCSLKALALPSASLQSPGYFDSENGPREVGPHYLIPEDPLFKSLTDLLLRFLTNDVETNLALTESIISLGSCSQLRLEGWLSVEPSDYRFLDDGIDYDMFGDDNLREMYKANRKPVWDSVAAPRLLACLQQLQEQVNALRADISDWDDHIASRKDAFRFNEEMSEAMRSATPSKLPRPSTDTPSGSWTPQPVKPPSGIQTPRGRKEGLDLRGTPNLSPAPSKLGNGVLAGSPSRGMSPLPAPPQAGKRQTTLMTDIDANFSSVKKSDFLKRRIRFKRPAGSDVVEVMLSKYMPPPKDETEDAGAGAEEMDDIREASLLHITTNVVILQEFILELAALLQVRASLFEEVRHI
ncbi:hypothetical protein GRF29_28g1647504, partial [Pseudopithomyces chartarum]